MRTLTLFAALLAAAAALPTSAAVAQNQQDCPGMWYDDPPTGTVVARSPVAVGHAAGFAINVRNEEAIVDGSVVYEVDGPAGHGTAGQQTTFTPPAVGHYTVSAHWRQYVCRDAGHETYADGSAPPVGFEVAPAKLPTTSFRITRHRRAGNDRGSAAISGFVECPGDEWDTDEPYTITIYYETGSRKPSHSSKSVRSLEPHGCRGGGSVFRKDKHGKGFALGAKRTSGFVNVAAPTKLRILFEIKSGDRLIGVRRIRFTPYSGGERALRE